MFVERIYILVIRTHAEKTSISDPILIGENNGRANLCMLVAQTLTGKINLC